MRSRIARGDDCMTCVRDIADADVPQGGAPATLIYAGSRVTREVS